MDMNKTGEFLAALRKSCGYTQQEVADHFNISNRTVSKWEQGGGYPDLTMLPVLAEFYQVTVDEILAGERISRQTQPDRQRGAVLRRHLLGRIRLHFSLCTVLVLMLTLLGGLFPYSVWCILCNILAAGVLLGGILISNYERRMADEALEDTQRRFLCRTVGQQSFLALALILWSSLFTASLGMVRLQGAILRSMLWIAAFTAGMVLLWVMGQKRWGGFFGRASGVLAGAGLVIFNLAYPLYYGFCRFHPDPYDPQAYEAADSVYQLLLAARLAAVALIAAGILLQSIRERCGPNTD